MKKSSAYDFSIPTRQSYAAILIIMYRLYKLLFRQLFPILIIVLLQGKLTSSPWFIYPLIIIAVLGAMYSVAAFFKYFFFLKKDKLVVKKGVFKQSTLEIPFDRIQSINFEQNLIHRIFKVVKLNMDTAGSKSNELQLYALDESLAQQLSNHILSSRTSTDESVAFGESRNEEKKVLFKLDLWQLIKVGFTENHIRSGGIILFFFFYIYDSLEDFGVDLIEKGEQYVPAAKQMAQSLTLVVIFAIIFVIVSLIISLVRTVLRYYNLQMYRKGEGFVIVSGLFNKKERAAKDEKIQIIKSSQNLLQSLTGLNELVMKQASSAVVSDAKSIKVVGLSASDVTQAKSYVLKSNYKESEEVTLNKVDFYFLFRRLYYSSIAFIISLLVFINSSRIDYILYSSILYAIALTASFLSYKKRKYGLGKEIVRINGGVFGHLVKLVEARKIQNIRINQSPFQRRRNLVSLILYTASGFINIPDIKKHVALEINDYLLYKVESNRKPWM